MNPAVARSLKLLSAMTLGILCPGAHGLQFLIRYLIMAMLWMAFLDIRPAGFRKEHAVLLGANWLIGLTAWAILAPFDRELALAGLLIGLTPTATAAPVVTGMLGGKVEFVAASVMLTNVSAGVLFPLVLPFVCSVPKSGVAASIIGLLIPTLVVILVPFAAAQAIRCASPRFTRAILTFRGLSFYAWLAVLFLILANASHFLRTEFHGSAWVMAGIPLLSALLCTANFAIGRKIGGIALAQEASQSLGQKNTMLTIWLAVTFLNPIVALGPTCYVLCHNGYNAWQLARKTD